LNCASLQLVSLQPMGLQSVSLQPMSLQPMNLLLLPHPNQFVRPTSSHAKFRTPVRAVAAAVCELVALKSLFAATRESTFA